MVIKEREREMLSIHATIYEDLHSTSAKSLPFMSDNDIWTLKCMCVYASSSHVIFMRSLSPRDPGLTALWGGWTMLAFKREGELT